jgi:hypothetical protein
VEANPKVGWLRGDLPLSSDYAAFSPDIPILCVKLTPQNPEPQAPFEVVFMGGAHVSVQNPPQTIGERPDVE